MARSRLHGNLGDAGRFAEPLQGAIVALHEGAAERADTCVEAGRVRALQIGEKARCPCCQVLCEEITIATVRSADGATDQACHGLTKSCNVILGFGMAHPLDTEKLETVAQFHQRTAVQRAG